MNDDIRKIFDILGVGPNEKFKVDGYTNIYYIDEDLMVFNAETGVSTLNMLIYLLNGTDKIIKLSKETKKKKLRELTPKEWYKWSISKCMRTGCDKCIFDRVNCSLDDYDSWINNKDLYSDKFLDQEIEWEE